MSLIIMKIAVTLLIVTFLAWLTRLGAQAEGHLEVAAVAEKVLGWSFFLFLFSIGALVWSI